MDWRRYLGLDDCKGTCASCNAATCGCAQNFAIGYAEASWPLINPPIASNRNPSLKTDDWWTGPQPVQAFPSDMGWTDVTKPPINAKGDGVHDDTKALQLAAANFTHVLFPPGTYLISDTIWARDSAASDHGQKTSVLAKDTHWVGVSADLSIIKLVDGAAGFNDSTKVKSVLHIGEGVAQNFNNHVRSLSVDVGLRNPGAVALTFNANNVGSVRNVSVVSHAPGSSGAVGFGFSAPEIGPLLGKWLHASGFATGVHIRGAVDSLTFERVVVDNFTQCGLVNYGQVVSVRGLSVVTGGAPGVCNLGPAGNGAALTLVDSSITCTDTMLPSKTGATCATGAGVNNTGLMYIRDLETQGLNCAVSSGDGIAQGNVIDGCWSSPKPNNVYQCEPATQCPSGEMSHEICFDCCSGKGFKYIGLGSCSCHCFDNISEMETASQGAPVSMANCNVKCKGHETENCGGDLAFLVMHSEMAGGANWTCATGANKTVAEYTSSSAVTLFPPDSAAATSLRLPIREVPEIAPEPLSMWVNALSNQSAGRFGCHDNRDESRNHTYPSCRIQMHAALANTSASTVYFNASSEIRASDGRLPGGYDIGVCNGNYDISKSSTPFCNRHGGYNGQTEWADHSEWYTVGPHVKRITGPVGLVGSAVLHIVGGEIDSPPLVVEFIKTDFSGVIFMHDSPRTVVFRSCQGLAYVLQ